MTRNHSVLARTFAGGFCVGAELCVRPVFLDTIAGLPPILAKNLSHPTT